MQHCARLGLRQGGAPFLCHRQHSESEDHHIEQNSLLQHGGFSRGVSACLCLLRTRYLPRESLQLQLAETYHKGRMDLSRSRGRVPLVGDNAPCRQSHLGGKSQCNRLHDCARHFRQWLRWQHPPCHWRQRGRGCSNSVPGHIYIERFTHIHHEYGSTTESHVRPSPQMHQETQAALRDHDPRKSKGTGENVAGEEPSHHAVVPIPEVMIKVVWLLNQTIHCLCPIPL
jgi:hypothetical protein